MALEEDGRSEPCWWGVVMQEAGAPAEKVGQTLQVSWLRANVDQKGMQPCSCTRSTHWTTCPPTTHWDTPAGDRGWRGRVDG